MEQTTVYNFHCLNCNCGRKSSEPIGIEMTKQEKEDGVNCPYSIDEAELPLKCVGQRVVGGYLRVASMTREQRAQVLRKRSHDHYKREVKPVRDAMRRGDIPT